MGPIRNPFAALLGICCCTGFALPAQPALPTSPPPPNIILILTDDAGYADFGFQKSGNDFATLTPNLDRLASRSVRFAQAYGPAALCCPSRAGLLTGRHPHRAGFENNTTDFPGSGLSPFERTLPEYLKPLGYRTYAYGKWHLGLERYSHPNQRGFDDFLGFLNGSRTFYTAQSFERPGEALDANGLPLPDPPGLYLTDYFADLAISRITEHRLATPSLPFFLYLPFSALHTPLEADPLRLADPRIAQIFPPQRRTLAAMTLAVDEAVGRLLDTLDRLQISENTLIVFVNDNGGPEDSAQFEPNWSDNTPLRGRKTEPYEGGVRVPMLLSWPAGIPTPLGGSTFDSPVSTLDLLPTFLSAAAPDQPLPDRLDGFNLLPQLSGEPAPERRFFWRTGGITENWSAARIGPWKMVRQDQTGETELFHLETDPSETTDLAQKEPYILRHLLMAHAEWENAMLDPLWGRGSWSISDSHTHLSFSDLGLALSRTLPGRGSITNPWRRPLPLDQAWRLTLQLRPHSNRGQSALLLSEASDSPRFIRIALCMDTQHLIIAEFPSQQSVAQPINPPLPPGTPVRLQVAFDPASRTLQARLAETTVLLPVRGSYPQNRLSERGVEITGPIRTDFSVISTP